MTDTIYDHPLYYDILFGWDRSREADTYHALLLASGHAPPDPIVEVACGTGQLARRLARRGWRTSGFDTSPAMLDFLRSEAAREGLDIETFEADMASVCHVAGFRAAVNPMSSFRLLGTDALAVAHLRSMAALLGSGGSYVLDLHLSEREDEPEHTTDEDWEMHRGAITVVADDDGITVRDRDDERRLAWGDGGHLRPLTATGFEALVATVPELSIRRWHPEVGREDDVSVFDLEGATTAPAGRTFVTLQRA